MSRLQKLILFTIILFSFGLRVYQLDTYGLYLDEKVTLLVSQAITPEGANLADLYAKKYFTPHEFWRAKTIHDFNDAVTRGDWGNSAFYYLILHYWIDIFGMSDFSIRFISVLFSVALISLLFHFVKTHFSNVRLALVVAALAAIEPFFIAQSHIVRNYSMSLFLTVLASHLFLLVLKNPQKRWLYLSYGFVATLCLFSHYLSFMVFVGHGLYVLLFVRNFKVWLGLAAVMLMPFVGMVIWMSVGGGQYSLKTVDDIEQFYQKVAKNPPTPNPYAGWIDPSTPKNVATKFVSVTSDVFIVSNGLASTLKGAKNLAISLLCLIATILCWEYTQRKKSLWVTGLAFLVNTAGFFLYSVAAFQFITLVGVGLILYWFVRTQWQAILPNKTALFPIVLLVFPLVWMVIQAFKFGHTVGINLRYTAFAIPYALICIGMMLEGVWALPKVWHWLIAVLFAPQLFAVGLTLKGIYDDTLPKYAYFSTPRKKNPFIFVANEIVRLYQPGDTLIYPNNTNHVFSAADSSKPTVSVYEAQLVNLYLPKDADYPQRIDPNEPNRIILWQKSTQKPKVIFNFEGLKYRY